MTEKAKEAALNGISHSEYTRYLPFKIKVDPTISSPTEDEMRTLALQEVKDMQLSYLDLSFLPMDSERRRMYELRGLLGNIGHAISNTIIESAWLIPLSSENHSALRMKALSVFTHSHKTKREEVNSSGDIAIVQEQLAGKYIYDYIPKHSTF